MIDAQTDDLERQFFQYLIPQGMRVNFPADVPLGYLLNLYPEACTRENVYAAVIDITRTWLEKRLNGRRRLNVVDNRWLSDMGDEISFQQYRFRNTLPEEELAREISKMLGGVYGMDTTRFDDTAVSTTFSVLLYLVPTSIGLYPPETAYLGAISFYVPKVWARILNDLQSTQRTVLPGATDQAG